MIFAILFPIVMMLLNTIAKMENILDMVKETIKHDSLTRLLNRSYFMDYVRESKDDGYILLVDVDNFKSVNDTFGHAGGDAALIQIAQNIEWGAGSEAVVARLGGEEFGVFLPTTDAHKAAEIAESILESVRSTPARYAEHDINLTVSIGGAPRQAGGGLRAGVSPPREGLLNSEGGGEKKANFYRGGV
ncbi:GGDEF domain-containing protein, partial [uncultured Sphingorhabdus sp.]|uniref:GGDEF domain-containing protein n=1 Tax=uncultured Sphingorhabdus sp. TaxID=1686106 RepID=UPI0026354A17